MKLAGWNIAEAFAKSYPKSRPRLENWRKHVHDASWGNPMDVKNTFNSANYIPSKEAWAFNIGLDRLIAIVDFVLEAVLIRHALTHSEYMKWSNKK